MPAVCRGQSEYLLRPAPPDIFPKRETGKAAADDLVGRVTLDSFGTGIPADDPALWVEHEDCKVSDSVEKHPVFFVAVSVRLLRKPASGAVALDVPDGGGGDQRAQDGSEDQYGFGLAQAPCRICRAQRRQSQLFVAQRVDDRMKLARDPPARSAANGVRRRRQTLGAAQTDDHLRELDLLSDQSF